MVGWKRVIEHKKTEKKVDIWKSQILNLRRMGLKIFEFQDQYMIDNFMLKLTQFEKTWLTGEIFISLNINIF